MTETVENLLILMRLAHVYDAESTLNACQKYVATSWIVFRFDVV